MGKKHDSDIVGWITRGGKHIPITKGGRKAISNSGETKSNKGVEVPEKYRYSNIKSRIDEIASDKYEDDTYDVLTKKPVSYNKGYQVTYFQIGDKYSEDEHNALIAEFLSKSDDGKVSLGKFEGAPEISFHFKSRSEAIKYAKRFNQISIWDWENMLPIGTGGTGERK